MAHDLDPSIEQPLRSSPLVAGLDRAAQDSLLWRFRSLPFQSGDLLIRAGDRNSDLFLLLEGFADVYARAGDKRYLVAILDPGSVLGEVSFFDTSRPRTADVVASSPGLAALLPRAAYDELLAEQHPAAESLERAVLQAVSLRMQYTNEALAELLDTHKSGGLLDELMRMYQKEGSP
jgi:CRP/FNR family transcriptional regulator, cyclic AMP receptor protein